MELKKEFYCDWTLEELGSSNEYQDEGGRFLISFDGEYFRITTVHGNMPYVKVVQVLMDNCKIKDWLTALREASLQYSNENRRHCYNLSYHQGSSGCLDVYIGSKIGLNYVQKYHLLHISMNDKINRGIRVPLIDLFVLWGVLKNYTPWDDGKFSIERIEETTPKGVFYSPLEIPDFYLQAEGYTPPPAVIEEEL